MKRIRIKVFKASQKISRGNTPMIIKDKNLKKKLDKIPDKDKNGEPIFKIAESEETSKKNKSEKKSNK